MRFMMLMIPRVYQGAEGRNVGPDFTPDPDDVARMTRFNDELADARVLLSLDGLHPSQKGARVSFKGGTPQVTGGPWADSNNVLGGYWMIDVKSRDEAVEWAKKVPAADGDVIEIRQVYEMSDFPPEVQKAAGQK